MPRILDTSAVVEPIAEIIKQACYRLPCDVVDALKAGLEREESPYGRDVLETLLENADYAATAGLPCCHDTGSCVLFAEIGQEVCWTGAPLEEMMNQGVAKGYGEGYLRKSMVRDPINRVNTGDNTPAIIHTRIVPGDRVRLSVLPKGGGSENMGCFRTLVPGEGAEGVKNYVLECMKMAGGKPCPPVVIGVGVGGTMDKCCEIAKEALLRPVGERNPDPFYAALEEDILAEINKLGIGPLGVGGRVTALDVHIEYFPCHITALPVAVNFQCHSCRRATAEI